MVKKNITKTLLASTMVLTMLANSGATIVNAQTATKGGDKTENVKPAGIEFQTEGDLQLGGAVYDNKGLQLQGNNAVTTGSLDFDYIVHSLASINWNDSTQAVTRLPEELNGLVETDKLKDYIHSAKFSYSSTTGGNQEYSYTKDDMKIEKDPQSNSYLLKFENPKLTGIGLQTRIEVHFNIDLGQMVTDTKVRIPHAIDKFHYNFGTTLASEGELIDWELVGNTNGTDNIPTEILDPGYDLLNADFKVTTPIYDTTTQVSGSGYPGATIIVRNDKGKDVGKAVVSNGGVYTVTFDTPQPAGTKLYFTQDTGVGESKAKIVTVEKDPDRLDPPTVSSNTISEKATSINGAGAEPGNRVTITNLSTGESLQTYALPNSTWICAIKEGWMIAGQELAITQSNRNGNNTSLPTYVEVVK